MIWQSEKKVKICCCLLKKKKKKLTPKFDKSTLMGAQIYAATNHEQENKHLSKGLKRQFNVLSHYASFFRFHAMCLLCHAITSCASPNTNTDVSTNLNFYSSDKNLHLKVICFLLLIEPTIVLAVYEKNKTV